MLQLSIRPGAHSVTLNKLTLLKEALYSNITVPFNTLLNLCRDYSGLQQG